ncbi:nuclear transport factor 2 family protein [Iodidimonas sp. SYSU 1G8]|uniref:nuclear transport factor 2 family protein n=1 Tax=Iodidimonas sp. SYSU 1G8 TaxID=3133967 RepID=UPI0031FEADB9
MSVAQDILEIQMLPQRYADAVMRHNGDDWSACWAKDGEWYLREEPVKGRESIRKIWEQAMAGFPFAVFLVQPAIVEVNGDTGTSRSYVTEILGTPDGNSFRVYGCYNDEVVREDGKWVFKSRRYARLYQGPVDLSGEKFPYS